MKHSIRPWLWVGWVAAATTACDSVPPATCPTGFRLEETSCRLVCSQSSDCLASEVCKSGVCLPPDPSDKPSIASFSVDPNPTTLGNRINIEYVVRNADTVTLTADGMQGASENIPTDNALANQLSYPVPGPRSLRLVASRGLDLASQTIELRITGTSDKVQIGRFVAEPQTVTLGSAVRLSWDVSNASRIQLFANGDLIRDNPPATTDNDVPNVTTVYELVATGSDPNDIASASVRVEVVGETLEIVRFAVGNAVAPREGDNAALIWETRGAQSILIQGPGGRVVYQSADAQDARSGVALVMPNAPSSSYTLIATPLNGSNLMAQVNINVVRLPAPPVIQSFTVEPDMLSTDLPTTNVRAQWSITAPPGGASVLTTQYGGTPIMGLGLNDFYDYHVSSTQTAYLVVRAENLGGAINEFHGVFARSSEIEPNNAQQDAQALNENAVDGSLGIVSGLDEDWYGFAVEDGGGVRAWLGANNCARGVRLGLYNVSDPTPIEEYTTGAAGSPCPHINRTGLAPNIYLLRVSLDPNAPVINAVDYLLRTEVLISVCGDGKKAASEVCDDGNHAHGDACSPDCEVPPSHTYMVDESTRPPPLTPQNPRQIRLRPYADAVMGSDPRDEGFATVELPFVFNFMGYRHKALAVHANGFISFLPVLDSPGDYELIKPFDRPGPDSVIAPFITDAIVPSGEITVWAKSTGIQELHIVYESVSIKDMQSSSNMNAEVILFEDGRIALQYGDMVLPSDVSISAGLEDETGKVHYYPSNACPDGLCPASDLSNRYVSFDPGG